MPEGKSIQDMLLSKVRLLPDKPGVYQFFDKQGKIIYVGKAKNLKKRVASYFKKDTSLQGKTRVMIGKTVDLQTIVVSTELDALLLENNLIKKLQPRYNIMLKDDKTFPWICIKNENFPRVFSTRSRIEDGSIYFGPYASITMMRTLLDLIRQLFTIRTCKLNLTAGNIKKKKFKVCLEYHIGNCRGPCEGLETELQYSETIHHIREILRGNLVNVIKELKERMMVYAASLEFEKAHLLKEKVVILENYKAKSTIVNASISNLDVCTISEGDQSIYCNYLKVIQGAVVQSHTLELRRVLDESPSDVLAMAILEFRQRYESTALEMLVPFSPGMVFPELRLTIPKKGDKKMLLDLSQRNATYFRLEREKQRELVDPARRTTQLMETMKKDLRLEELPRHIECFDNSNIQGSHAVAAVVVFRDGKPEKKDYRHFNIKTVEGPDDFASMEEIVFRRYKRLLDEKQPLPQLIIIDGGKGQLNSAVKSLDKLGILNNVKIIGIAKRLEELYYPGDPLPLYLDKKSQTLKVIQHARDEAHRFGITHHRKKRTTAMTKSILSDIEGIGYTNAQKLLWKFKSVKNIQSASLVEIEDAIGKSKARKVFDFFHAKTGMESGI